MCWPKFMLGRTQKMERIIVRRGRFLTYELLRRTFGGDPNVEIIWDRRRAVDPVPEVGGQLADRRGRLPDQWYRLDYMFTRAVRAAFPAATPTPEEPDDRRDKISSE
jgi:hypothetical protein